MAINRGEVATKQHSAGVITVRSVKSSDFVSNYNSQDKKLDGKWRDQEPKYQKKDLLTFHGQSNYDYENIDKQVKAFQKQVKTNLKIKKIKINSQTKKGNYLHDKNDCLTIIQSFDIDANPDLTPKEAHQIGDQLFNAYRKYLKQNYNYDLTSGFISTHIDRGDFKRQKENGQLKVLQPHLHNHIVIPTNNEQGKSISPFMKKANIIDIRDMNDQIVLKHGLKDYYLQKLSNRLRPNPRLLNRKNINNKNDIDIAIKRFTDINNKIKYNNVLNNFNGSKDKRDEYLKKNYGYQVKTVYTLSNDGKSQINPHVVFTMKDFSTKGNHEACFYDIRDVGALAWSNQEQALNSLNISVLDLNNTKGFAQSPDDYQETLSKAMIEDLPVHDVAKDLAHKRLKEEQEKKQQKNINSQDSKSKIKNHVKKQANYLQTMLDIDADNNQFEFSVTPPLHYMSDDFKNRRFKIKEIYRKLMNNEHVDDSERKLKDKVTYVQKDNESVHKEQTSNVDQQITKQIKQQEKLQRKARLKNQNNKMDNNHPHLK